MREANQWDYFPLSFDFKSTWWSEKICWMLACNSGFDNHQNGEVGIKGGKFWSESGNNHR